MVLAAMANATLILILHMFQVENGKKVKEHEVTDGIAIGSMVQL